MNTDLSELLKRHSHTANGNTAAVVQDAEACQRLLDIAAGADAREGIRQGMEDVKKRKVRLAKEFFEEFEAKRLK